MTDEQQYDLLKNGCVKSMEVLLGDLKQCDLKDFDDAKRKHDLFVLRHQVTARMCEMTSFLLQRKSTYRSYY